MEYLTGSPDDFHKFIKDISKKDKIGILTHIDSDGIASAILLQKILESQKLKVSFIEFLDYSSNLLKNINKSFDILFITDLNADNYIEDLSNLRKKGKVLLVDHHPINQELKDKSGIIKTDSSYCSSHALFDLGEKYIDTKKWEWLVCSAIIMDYTYTNDDKVLRFLKSVYPKIDIKNAIESVPGNTGRKISNSLIYYKPDYKKVYDLILENNFEKLKEADEIIEREIAFWINKFKKEAEYFPKQKLYFYHGNPKYPLFFIISTILSEVYSKNSVILISDSLDKKEHIRVTARNQTGNIKLGEILKKCTKGFEDSSAGGHDRASGCDFPKKYLDEFKERLLNELVMINHNS